MFDHNTYVTNRSKFTWEQLAPYQGQYVAWSADGKQILAVHPDLGELLAEMDRRGADTESYICDWVDPDPVILPPEAEEGQTGAA